VACDLGRKCRSERIPDPAPFAPLRLQKNIGNQAIRHLKSRLFVESNILDFIFGQGRGDESRS